MSSWVSFAASSNVAEWLVLDNGSTDGTLQWLHSFSRRVSKLRVIAVAENLGCAGGRNRLFAEATGDLLFSLDSDVWLKDQNKIANMVYALEQNKTVGIVGAHGGWIKNDWSWTQEAPRNYVGIAPIVSGYCQMFRRSVLSRVTLDMAYNPYWLEDSDFCLQILTKLGQTGQIMRCGVYHAWSKTNSGSILARKSKWDYFKAKWQKTIGARACKPDSSD